MKNNTAEVLGIRRSAARGALIVIGRQVAVQCLNIAGAILLTRLFTPAEFGLYAILLFIAQGMTLLSGPALALQVVRSPVELSVYQLRVLFTGQVALTVTAAVVIWIFAPLLSSALGFGSPGANAFRIISAVLFASSFQSIPTALLERNLRFDKVALSEILQAVVFNTIAVAGAAAGFGVIAVAVAMLCRVLIGSLITNLLQRWPIGFAFNLRVFRAEVASGATYFGSALVSFIKDAITPVFLGSVMGAAEVGFVNWAVMLSSYCLIALMMMQRLYVPTFSRMAAHPAELGVFVTGILKLTNAVAAPVACLILVLIEPITVNVFGEKWLPAIPAFYLFWLANLIVPTITPLVSLLQALNEGRLVFNITLLWMALTWLIGVPAVFVVGFLGPAVANVVVQFSNYLVYRAAKRHVHFKVFSSVLPFWGAAVATAALVYVAHIWWPAESVMHVVGYLVAGLLLYAAVLFVLCREDVNTALALLRSHSA